MNRVFRIIWSHTRQAFVVADELASARGKRSGARLLLAAASAGLLLASQVGVAQAADVCSGGGTTIISSPANPGDECQLVGGASLTVEAGGGSISSAGNAVSTSDNAAVGTITNGGSIAGDIGIFLAGDNGTPSTGVAITNQVDATISGVSAGIAIGNYFTLGSLSNAGDISASNGLAINILGDITGNVRNEAAGRLQGSGGGIFLDGSNVGGDIVNAGNITSDINSDSRAIDLADSTVGGKLESSGVIRVTDKGFSLYKSTVTGNVVNSGSIVTIGHVDTPEGAGDEDGVSLYASQIIGSLINSGTIDANDDGIGLKEAETAPGIWVRSSILGDLINAVGATVSAEDDGLDLEDSDIGGFIRNQGTIIGRTSNGIEIDRLTAQGMELGGLTQGQTRGMRLRDITLTDGITITGTVRGDEYAIEIDSDSQANIDIGTGAQLVGDVLAENADVKVLENSTFNNLNAFNVKKFTVENGATLNMGAGHSTSRDLDNSGILDGFTVSAGFFNNGTLALASGVTGSIHGDYNQSASGTLKIGVADNTTFGKLVVNGTADIGSNAKIAVNVSNPNYSFSVASLQDVLSATSLDSDGSFDVSDNSLLFDFGAVKDGNTVDLTISAAANSGNGLIEDIVTGLGNTPAVGAAKVLDKVISGNPSGELAGHFVGLSNQQQVSEAVSSTLPTVAGSSSSAIGDTLSGVNRVVQARQASNSGLSSGDAVADDNLWVKTFGAWAEQDERNSLDGYDATTQGLAIGADAAVSEHARLGLAFAYAQTKLDSDSHVAPQSADIDTFQLIGYGSYALDANTELNFQLDGGQNRVDSTRHMPFANATAKADYDGYNLHAGAGIGHSLRLSDQLTFIPSARADYTWIESEAYREKGAGALNLDVDSNDAEELLLSVDGKLDYQLSAATVASANLGAGYDVIDEDSAIASTYAGAPGATFKTTGMDLEPWLARAGLGLSHTLPGGTEVSLRYDAEVRSDFTNQGASLKARWAF
ncbi:MAG: hypothetical protein C0439_07010 [Pseudomonas sp.]|nr:hypothetical protein [Pseudomonas sp.]